MHNQDLIDQLQQHSPTPRPRCDVTSIVAGHARPADGRGMVRAEKLNAEFAKLADKARKSLAPLFQKGRRRRQRQPGRQTEAGGVKKSARRPHANLAGRELRRRGRPPVGEAICKHHPRNGMMKRADGRRTPARRLTGNNEREGGSYGEECQTRYVLQLRGECQAEEGQEEGRRQEVQRLARLRRRRRGRRGKPHGPLQRPPPALRPPARRRGDDNGEGLPTPARIKLAARRAAGIAEAKAVLDHLPGPGESLHAVCTARMDLTDVIGALGGRLGPCDRMLIATLGYNEANLRTMLGWLDAGAVRSLTLLASIFFRSHKGDLWAETLKEFRARKQRAACCHSHAKVVTLAFASGATLGHRGQRQPLRQRQRPRAVRPHQRCRPARLARRMDRTRW